MATVPSAKGATTPRPAGSQLPQSSRARGTRKFAKGPCGPCCFSALQAKRAGKCLHLRWPAGSPVAFSRALAAEHCRSGGATLRSCGRLFWREFERTDRFGGGRTRSGHACCSAASTLGGNGTSMSGEDMQVSEAGSVSSVGMSVQALQLQSRSRRSRSGVRPGAHAFPSRPNSALLGALASHVSAAAKAASAPYWGRCGKARGCNYARLGLEVHSFLGRRHPHLFSPLETVHPLLPAAGCWRDGFGRLVARAAG